MSDKNTVSAAVADALSDVLILAKDNHDYLTVDTSHYPSCCEYCLQLMRSTAILREATGHGPQFTQFSQHRLHPYNEWATQIDTDDAAADTQGNPLDYDEWVRNRMRLERNSQLAHKKARL